MKEKVAMNRRGFLGGLLKGALTLGAAPQLLTSLAKDRQRWKSPVVLDKKRGIWVVNPKWIKAPYECSFLYSPKTLEDMENLVLPVIYERHPDGIFYAHPPTVHGRLHIKDNWPMRYNMKDDGEFELVPPIMEI